MAIRTINYDVSASGIAPQSQQFGGTMGDHNVTELVFALDTALFDSIRAEAGENKVVYRFDGYDGSGCMASTVPQELTEATCSYMLEEWLTRHGGNIKVYLVITEIENDSTARELYSFPALLNLKSRPDAETVDGEAHESISTLAEATKKNAQKAEQALNELLISVPQVTVEQATDGAVITVKDKNGETAAVISNGKNGADGKNGVDGKVDYSQVANALKGAAQGKVVALKDVSPLEHDVKVKLSSNTTSDFSGEPRLVVDTSTERTMSGLSLTEARVYMESGAMTFAMLVLHLSDGNVFYLGTESSFQSLKENAVISINGTEATLTTTRSMLIDGEWQTYTYTDSLTVAEGTVITGYDCMNDFCIGLNDIDKLQIWDISSKKVTLSQFGKNYFDVSKVVSNNYIINNGDGSIFVKVGSSTSRVAGTPNTLRDYAPNLKVGETYFLSGYSTPIENSSYENNYIYLSGTGANVSWMFNDATKGKLKITEDLLNAKVMWYAWGKTNKTTTISNIQIEVGTTATEYEPYQEPKTYTANADGSVDVEYMYPSMTLMTDAEDVTIMAEYNKDINKAFAELQAALISMGGNV